MVRRNPPSFFQAAMDSGLNLETASREELIAHVMVQRNLIRSLYTKIVDLEEQLVIKEQETHRPSNVPATTFAQIQGELENIQRVLQSFYDGEITLDRPIVYQLETTRAGLLSALSQRTCAPLEAFKQPFSGIRGWSTHTSKGERATAEDVLMATQDSGISREATPGTPSPLFPDSSNSLLSRPFLAPRVAIPSPPATLLERVQGSKRQGTWSSTRSPRRAASPYGRERK